MSTYWYLECTEHDPPLQSADEVEQHTSGLPKIRDMVAKRDELMAVTDWMIPDGYFERNAARFLIQHPKCNLRLVSEYGTVESLAVPVSTGRAEDTQSDSDSERGK